MATDDSYVPHIFDDDNMAEHWATDPQMFDSTGLEPDLSDMGGEAAFDYNQYLNNDAFSSPARTQSAMPGYPSPAKAFAARSDHTPAPLQSQSAALQPRSQMSSSPASSSSQDSASETSGRRKRKLTSSDSSPSQFFGGGADTSMDEWHKDSMAGFDMPHAHDSIFVKRESSDFLNLENDVDTIGKTMASSAFEVGSSGSSPAIFTCGSPNQTVVPSKLEQHSSQMHANPSADFIIGARDESPMSGMSSSHEPSPAAGIFSSAPLWNDSGYNSAFPNHPYASELSPTQAPLNYPPAEAIVFPNAVSGRPRLHISQEGSKSRVETQIGIRLILDPVPAGVTKLHLPRNAVSKPKLLAKEIIKAPETLELFTSLVCASAMEKPELQMRALKRASSYQSNARKSNPRRSSQTDMPDDDPDDPDKPANGGEVRICQNCVQRERKRAARKRVKKQEDEEAWAEYENERVIVFNDKEYKDWGAVTPPKAGDVPQYSPTAMQIEVPMRIACYCRHQGEKNGFRVIFTIKDYRGKVIAQSMTSPILITDDHKTQGGPVPSSTGMHPDPNLPFTPLGTVTEQQQDLQSGPHRRPYFSTNDLQSLQNNWTGPKTFPRPTNMSQATVTPRNLSRQTSPVGAQTGPNKKRKSSATHHHKVPRDLAMTQLNRGGTATSPGATAEAMAMATTMPSTSMPQGSSYATANDPHFMMQPVTIPPYASGPSTPGSNAGYVTPNTRSGSMDALNYPFLSMPNSTQQSRAPSPSLGRQSMGGYNPAPIPANMVGTPMNLLQSHMDSPGQVTLPPSIYKVTPGEYSKSGGIEISILGSNFTRDMEIYFGDTIATTTTFWNNQLLVSLLPPSPHPAVVPVTVRMQNGYIPTPGPGPIVSFKYVDDDDQRICEMALRILCQKQNGNAKADDYRGFARHVVTMASNRWTQNGGNMQQRFDSAFPPGDTEEILLRYLDLVDMDDSPHLPRFNMKNKTGATFLSLACSLGYGRVVAGLLARGANPDTRDRGGYTPLMMAAMHGHAHIVRRLIAKGADPMMRSLQGYLPSDLATSEEVLNALQRVTSHRRTRSAGSVSFSMRSRASSIASTHSVWESSSPSYVSEAEADYEDEGEESEEPVETPSAPGWVPSRRGSAKEIRPLPLPSTGQQDQPALPVVAAMNAWRENLSVQINQFQQNMHWNLPNLQLPALPPLPNLPGYQAHPMMRRISSLVPHRSPPRTPSSSTDGMETPSESNGNDYKWKDLFSTPAAPPAYEEIFPENADKDTDVKKMSVAHAVADHLLDQACVQKFDVVAESSSDATKGSLNVELGKKSLTKEEQDQVRRAHAQKLKRIRSDRNLFFIWIPLLLIILCAMLRSRLPQLWAAASAFFGAVQERTTPGRVVEVA
ncbi:ankyrin repeat protein [Diplodia corticola]|uniref:Ankyrin repeat protein n=1 Tax=Diplodia corticola TaxID=236234 RepID=A0A1J9QMA0_9PEZI|nr:ankyrin repeat protein [Diplodia corticola]OJD29194.1 ankyrin repeat protein [Diplodia corticola]